MQWVRNALGAVGRRLGLGQAQPQTQPEAPAMTPAPPVAPGRPMPDPTATTATPTGGPSQGGQAGAVPPQVQNGWQAITEKARVHVKQAVEDAFRRAQSGNYKWAGQGMYARVANAIKKNLFAYVDRLNARQTVPPQPPQNESSLIEALRVHAKTGACIRTTDQMFKMFVTDLQWNFGSYKPNERDPRVLYVYNKMVKMVRQYINTRLKAKNADPNKYYGGDNGEEVAQQDVGGETPWD
jgi:hypothetical protein